MQVADSQEIHCGDLPESRLNPDSECWDREMVMRNQPQLDEAGTDLCFVSSRQQNMILWLLIVARITVSRC